MFGVSYPTIKARLNRIAAAARIRRHRSRRRRAARCSNGCEQGEISAADAIRRTGGAQMMPPLMLKLHVESLSRDGRRFRLWLPLFLFWLLLLPFALVTLPVAGAGARVPRLPAASRLFAACWSRAVRASAGSHIEVNGAARLRFPPRLLKGNIMSENRKQILEMLAGASVTADEAERLIAALDGRPRRDRRDRAPCARAGARNICASWSSAGHRSMRRRADQGQHPRADAAPAAPA